MNWAETEAPHHAIKRAFKNPAFQKSFYDLKNLDTREVLGAFDRWADVRRLPRRTRRNLRDAIDVRRAAEFRDAVAKCAAWIARQRPAPYAMILEVAQSGAAKSSLWLAGPAVRALMEAGIPPPAAVVPFVDGAALSVVSVRRALQQGVRTFVHVDDALYSGTQKGIMVRQLSETLDFDKVSARLLLAVAYVTDLGARHVRQQRGPRLRLKMYAPHVLRVRRLPWVSRVELMLRGDRDVRRNIAKGGPTSSLLAHKVPDSLSFGPATLSYHLQAVLPKPVYKTIPL